jgi:hypothetical protein
MQRVDWREICGRRSKYDTIQPINFTNCFFNCFDLGVELKKAFLLTLLNSLVHTFMYAYYGLSALGDRVKKFLWWKKYLTQMQLVRIDVHSKSDMGSPI